MSSNERIVFVSHCDPVGARNGGRGNAVRCPRLLAGRPIPASSQATALR
jgi:hypothetical protein